MMGTEGTDSSLYGIITEIATTRTDGIPTTTAPSRPRVQSQAFWITVDVLYTIISVLILLGNSVTIVAIQKFSALRNSASNVYILFLCVADIILFPPTLGYLIQRYGTWNTAALRASVVMVKLPLFLSFHLSVLTHICIAVDRLLAVTLSLRYKIMITRTKATIIASITWLYMILCLGIPICYYGLTADPAFLPPNVSYVRWLHPVIVQYLNVQVWFGFCFIILIYIIVIIRILQQRKKIATASNQDKNYMRGMKKTTKMTFTIVLCLVICWLPFSTYTAVVKPNPDFIYFFRGFHVLLTLNSCTNPVIYYWLHNDFRKAYRSLLGMKELKVNSSETMSNYTETTAP